MINYTNAKLRILCIVYIFNSIVCASSFISNKNIISIVSVPCHIFATNKLNLAKIVIDPMYINPEHTRKLESRKNRRGRPKNVPSALKKLDKF